MIARPCIDLVARLEPPDLRANPGDDPGNVVAQNEGRTIRQEEFELSVPHLGVQKVHTCCVNSNHDIIVSHLRLRYFGQAQSALLFVFVDNECLHGVLQSEILSRRQAPRKDKAFGTKSAWF